MRTTDVDVVGREEERAAVRHFLEGDGGSAALVVMGEPGVGKTTLWEAGVGDARDAGSRVLVARPSEPEQQVSFSALADLLDEVSASELTGVPKPRLRAVEVALRRADPGLEPPDSLGVSAGFTDALRALAGVQPLLVAVDDLPWLDRNSGDVLAYAARRLGRDRVRFLLARRLGEASGLERAFVPIELRHLELGPFSLGATRLLLAKRLGLSLPWRVMRQVFELAGGNPLFALELGRVLAERGTSEIGAELPLPESIEDLFGSRVRRLRPRLRRLLLAAALSGDLSSRQLTAIASARDLQAAVAAGLLVAEGNSARPSHPLLSAVVRRDASPPELQAAHLALAEVVDDEPLRALHQAQASPGVDGALAAGVGAAAALAISRGASQDAVALAREALRLTPAVAAERTERVLELAEYLMVAFEFPAATELLSAHVAELPPGNARARAFLLLGEAEHNLEGHEEYLKLALAEPVQDAALRARALARRALFAAVHRVVRLVQAEALAEEAVHTAERAEAGIEPSLLGTLAWTRVLRGRPVDDFPRPLPTRSVGSELWAGIERPAAVRLAFRGEIELARAAFDELLSVARQRGEVLSEMVLRFQLLELELRAGEAKAALRTLAEWDWDELSGEGVGAALVYNRCEAMLAAVRGLPEQALRHAQELLTTAKTLTDGWDLLEVLRAKGVAALCARDARAAADDLGRVWEHTLQEGVADPGAFPAAPDLVEALVELRNLEQARAVAERLEQLAIEQQHPWGLASARRCLGLIRLTSGYDEPAAAQLAEAAEEYRGLGLRFDEARSLLALGRAQRHFKKWAAARGSLEQAVAVFEEMGSAGWADQARFELARVGARRPAPAGELTPTEAHVARLAAEGLSNKEIATALVVTVHTVEKHLSHVYAKLGVSSRAKLAQRLVPR